MAGPDLHEEYLDRARALVPALARSAAQAEADRQVTGPVIDAAADADLFRMVTPRRWGGCGLGLSTLAQTTRVLAHGCPATAWTLSFLVMHNWLLSMFPPELQAEVFADRPYALVPAPLAPTGRMTACDGGYRLNGRWEWATGVQHADWVMVHALDAVTMTTRFAVVPVDQVTVEDVWFTSGMCATGSNAVTIDDVFVPEARSSPARPMFDEGSTQGDDLDHLPVVPVLALVAAAPAVGAAEASVDLFRERISERILAYTLGDRQVDQPGAQIRLAGALAEMRAARALWDAAIADLEASVSSAAGTTVEDRVGARLAAAAAVRMSRSVIATVCEGSGASVYATSNPMQRLQRDVEVLKGHAVFDWDRTCEVAGRVALGLELRPTDMV